MNQLTCLALLFSLCQAGDLGTTIKHNFFKIALGCTLLAGTMFAVYRMRGNYQKKKNIHNWRNTVTIEKQPANPHPVSVPTQMIAYKEPVQSDQIDFDQEFEIKMEEITLNIEFEDLTTRESRKSF